MSLKDFEKVTKLGDGAYSTVYKVIRISDQQIYALKKIKLASLTSKQKQNALNQIRILASINHPNIIAYKQAFFDQTSKSLWYQLSQQSIVMEYANDSDLETKIKETKKANTSFCEKQIWHIVGCIVKGLAELHRLGVYHRDIKVINSLIKPANIFLHKIQDQLVAKIGDLNVSKVSQQGLCMTQTGTPYYASPQVWKDLPYDQKSDIWSLGCVIYELIALKPPFQAQDMEGLYKKVTRGIYAKISTTYSSDLSSILRVLLQVDPQSRPRCNNIMKMPSFINNVEDNNVQKINNELMKTIKGENFNQLNQILPKPTYLPPRPKKQRQKGIKSMMNQENRPVLEKSKSIKNIVRQEQRILEIRLLKNGTAQKLSKQKSIKKYDHTDRTYNKQKSLANLLGRQRKKSQISISKAYQQQYNSSTKHSVHNVVGELKETSELKLPKVKSRYNKIKQRINKQNSLRVYKAFGNQ